MPATWHLRRGRFVERPGQGRWIDVQRAIARIGVGRSEQAFDVCTPLYVNAGEKLRTRDPLSIRVQLEQASQGSWFGLHIRFTR